jgi:membrane protein DedA with SNARE-associated domain
MDTVIVHFVNNLEHIPALAVYGFLVLWLAAESCGIPLPNELVLLATGSIAAQPGSKLSPVLLVVLAVAASLAGASAAYELGKRGGRVAVLRFGKPFRLDEARLDGVERWFRRTGPVAIAIARCTPFVRTYASFPAGVLELPYISFVIATTIGSLVWCAVMVTLGYVLGKDYLVALHLIERYTVPALVVLAALVAGYIWLHRRLAHAVPGANLPSAPPSDATSPTGKTASKGDGKTTGKTTGKTDSATVTSARRPSDRHAARKLR